ncbi:MAG: hypothetical protein ACI9AR_000448 [Flavobacteriaceae bacterium]|jgi:hypothetical protein
MQFKYENMEKPKPFDAAYQDLLAKGIEDFVDREKIPNVVGFLKYLVQEKGYLLHGSSNKEIKELEPRQANCKSKKFGNEMGVYAVQDEVLPVFYAIKDAKKAHKAGVSSFSAESGFSSVDDKKDYTFKITKAFIDADAWSDGSIYILDGKTFEQGEDDEGEPIDEWLSKEPVMPVGKVKVDKDDFPYFTDIEPVE